MRVLAGSLDLNCVFCCMCSGLRSNVKRSVVFFELSHPRRPVAGPDSACCRPNTLSVAFDNLLIEAVAALYNSTFSLCQFQLRLM